MAVTLDSLLAGRRIEDLSDEELQSMILEVRHNRRGIRTPKPRKAAAPKKAPKAAADAQALLAFLNAQIEKLKGEPDA